MVFLFSNRNRYKYETHTHISLNLVCIYPTINTYVHLEQRNDAETQTISCRASRALVTDLHPLALCQGQAVPPPPSPHSVASQAQCWLCALLRSPRLLPPSRLGSRFATGQLFAVATGRASEQGSEASAS